jgi:succinate dehydrogenase/fumarate reductase flavoprotein subunit
MATATHFDVDVLVAGTGVTGLTAAVVARSLGLNTLLVERTDKIGGTTSYSGGTVWIPNNMISTRSGVQDTGESARRYLDGVLERYGPRGPGSSDARVDAFLTKGPEMVEFLASQGFEWSANPSPFPDYHSDVEGALPSGGRTLDPAPVDASALGSWKDKVRRPPQSVPAQYFHDFCILTRPGPLPPTGPVAATMESAAYMGCSLVAQLLALYLRDEKNQQSIHLGTPLIDLLVEDGHVRGGKVRLSTGSVATVSAKYGVILATAGFARSQALRDLHLPLSQTKWTLAQPGGDLGDALLACAETAGAATALLGEAWWIPIMADPLSGQTVPAMFEISKPHCIIVDEDGVRFMSEPDPYGDAGRALYTHVVNMRRRRSAWLILDSNYRQRYTLGSLGPGIDPGVGAGSLHRADTISQLASRINVNPAGLDKTIADWNKMCETGPHSEFDRRRRGRHQTFVGDSSARHPNVGPIVLPPFYAIAIYPGDAGTKGGLLTDELSRVVRPDHSVIPGLYAAGNATASVMGPASPAAGVTIGPAMTFAYIAVRDIYERKQSEA